MKTIVVIYNYNLPSETDEIYDKLISDGFDENEIVIVDNGSDKNPKASSTNFALPVNIRFTGQAYISLIYLLDFFEFDNFLLITTSAGLKSGINYKNEVMIINSKFKNKFGFVTASLSNGLTKTNAIEQSYEQMTDSYKKVFKYQPIVTLISKELLECCREKKAAYFNLNLKRGWGIDRELQYIANTNGLECYVSRDLSVNWNTNLAHKKGLADESQNKYHVAAESEMSIELSRKYGPYWESIFESAFYNKPIKPTFKNIIKNILVKIGIYKIYIKIFKR